MQQLGQDDDVFFSEGNDKEELLQSQSSQFDTMSLNSSQSLIWTSDGSPRQKKEASNGVSNKQASEPKKSEMRSPPRKNLSSKNAAVRDPNFTAVSQMLAQGLMTKKIERQFTTQVTRRFDEKNEKEKQIRAN